MSRLHFAALVALAAISSAQITVIENFDALNEGLLTGQNAWQSLSSGGGAPTVFSPAGYTSKALRWTGGGSTHMKVFKSAAYSVPAGLSTLSFSFYVGEVPFWGASICFGRTGTVGIVAGTAANTGCDLAYHGSLAAGTSFIVRADGSQVPVPGAVRPANTKVTLELNTAINAGSGCLSVYFGNTLVIDKVDARLVTHPSTWDLLAVDWEASPEGIYFFDSFQWEQLTQTRCDACEELSSEWLTTEYMPVLDAVASGFNVPLTKDEFLIRFTYHRKYFDVVPSSGALSQASGAFSNVAVAEFVPSACWDTYTVQVSWANLVTECARSEQGGASGWVIYTCKLEIDAKEQLDPIRDSTLVREIHNELPFTVRFPKQVSAAVSNLSAFKPPNVLAAVIRQAVTLDVSAVTDVDAKIRLFTSTQYPFTLVPASANVVSTPADLTVDSFANVVDCVHPNTPDVPNKPVDDALACSQEWLLDLQVDAAVRCDLDGVYKVNFRADCYSTFASDCPLVKDDLGAINDIFEVTFTIDSEYFCAQVVDTVDVGATLTVWKDHAHTVSASNFIHGQTAYFVASASSNKVTVVGLSVDDIDVDVTGAPNAGHFDFFTDGVANPANPANIALVVENSDDAVAPVPDNQAWFQWVVSDPPFAAPADGSSDFNVDVTLNVLFKDATGLLSVQKVRLLQGNGASSQQFGANTEFKMSVGDTETASAVSVHIGLVTVACTLLLAIVA